MFRFALPLFVDGMAIIICLYSTKIHNNFNLTNESFVFVNLFQMSDCMKWGSVGMNAGLIMVMNQQKSHAAAAAATATH